MRHVLTGVVEGTTCNVNERQRLSIANYRSLPRRTRGVPAIQFEYKESNAEKDDVLDAGR